MVNILKSALWFEDEYKFYLLEDPINRQNFEPALYLERFPILGFLVSIPTALTAGALAVHYAAKAVFSNFSNKLPHQEAIHTQALRRKAAQIVEASYWESSRDCAILCINQIFNICTLGLLNNIFINTAIAKRAAAKAEALAEEEFEPL